MIDCEILLIDCNNVAESYPLDDPVEGAFMEHDSIWRNRRAGMKGTCLYNVFVQMVLGYFMLSDETKQDILAGRFKIGCYIYDLEGNADQRFSDSEHVLKRALLDLNTRQWSSQIIFSKGTGSFH